MRGNWHTEQVIRARRQLHGQPGNLNGYVLDVNSAITGYGTHNRVVPECPRNGTLAVRIDRKWHLRDPTDAEMLRVARVLNGPRDMGGQWRCLSQMQSDDGQHAYVTFARVQ